MKSVRFLIAVKVDLSVGSSHISSHRVLTKTAQASFALDTRDHAASRGKTGSPIRLFTIFIWCIFTSLVFSPLLSFDMRPALTGITNSSHAVIRTRRSLPEPVSFVVQPAILVVIDAVPWLKSSNGFE